MQQILKAKFILRPGYFEDIQKDQRAKRQRKLQRQPAPMRKIGFNTDVPAQYPKQPQHHCSQDQTQKAVCSPVDFFGEPQLQGKSQPDKYRSQEGQVIWADMESICVQVVLLLQSLFQIINLLVNSKYRFIYTNCCNKTEHQAVRF